MISWIPTTFLDFIKLINLMFISNIKNKLYILQKFKLIN